VEAASEGPKNDNDGTNDGCLSKMTNFLSPVTHNATGFFTTAQSDASNAFLCSSGAGPSCAVEHGSSRETEIKEGSCALPYGAR
jgi:hypothetical protein